MSTFALAGTMKAPMVSITLTRKEYDTHIVGSPVITYTAWNAMRRDWTLGGVKVTGTVDQMAEVWRAMCHK